MSEWMGDSEDVATTGRYLPCLQSSRLALFRSESAAGEQAGHNLNDSIQVSIHDEYDPSHDIEVVGQISEGKAQLSFGKSCS